MMTIAPISSNIANEVRKTFKLAGTRDPNKERIPNAKAISVAVGIAHPCKATSLSMFK